VDADLRKELISRTYFDETAGDADALRRLIARPTDPGSFPQASTIEKNIPIYDMDRLRGDLAEDSSRRALMAEWTGVFRSGPGVLVLKRAYTDTTPIDAATAIYLDLIAHEKETHSAADHFAAAGSNDRLWNSLQKLCLAAPDVFARYFSNPAIDAVSEAWLGPGYQMTAQVNLVHPGGAAQEAHRDYHLGFQTAAQAASFPRHMHDLSPLLTLQGAIAHCDMPLESGPTKLLPFSHLLADGYVGFRKPEIRELFEANCVQMPLSKGDAVFFNPALLHAAGENTSADIERFVNLLQVSSPMGIALERIDRTAMSRALYPALKEMAEQGGLTQDDARLAIACAADGYPFPTNLDTDPPIGGLAPETQQGLMLRALREGWPVEDFNAELDAQDLRRRA
jgi:ectoine hydroxylase-related dioxygenase (phytanoyl-CoA dioxygenase family)